MKLNSLRKNKVISSVLAISLFLLQSNAFALPQGEEVVSGVASFDRSLANKLTVTTPSDRLIVNYNSFNIAQPESVSFIQPSDAAVALNRVTGGDPTSILGKLSANGKIFVVNPNGIVFGANSHVDAAGLVASTLGISNADFLAGRYNFTQNSAGGYVVNQGQINITNGGYALLLANAVTNSGSIIAHLGKVVLAAGEKITVALDDLNDIAVTVDDAVGAQVIGPDGKPMSSGILNSGTIQADGGKVVLNAKVLKNIFDTAVNNSGVVEAKGLVNRNGVVELTGEGGSVVLARGSLTSAKAKDDTAQGGQVIIKSSRNTLVYSGAAIDVSGGLLGGDAGFIEVSAKEQLGLQSTNIYTNAAVGFSRGTVFIDPDDITIATGGADTPTGDNASPTADELYTDHAATNLTIAPGALTSLTASEVYLQAARDIFINNDLALNTSLKLEAGNNITVNANVSTTGGAITLTADADASGTGAITMASGTVVSGNGNITFNAGSGLTLRGINAGTGTLTLNNTTSGTVSQAAGGLTAANLLLKGKGLFNLDSLSNDAGTMAANITGALTYKDTNALTVDTVNSIFGVRSNNNNITLTTGGILSLKQDLKAGVGATLIVNAAGVNQTAGSLNATNMFFSGTGTFNMGTSNNVADTLAANVTGAFNYKDLNALTIDTVAGFSGGINSAGNNISIRSGALTINKDIDAGTTGTIALNATGTTQSSTSSLKAAALTLAGSAYTLDSLTNNVGALATSSALSGLITFYNNKASGLIVGVGNNGISTNDKNVTLVNKLGQLKLDKSITVGNGAVRLDSQAGALQSDGAITASSVAVTGSGNFTLTSTANNVVTFAANVSGDLSYTDANAFTIASLLSADGVTTISGINVGNNTLTLSSGSAPNPGGITQSASITADKLSLSGTGTFTLNSANDVNTVASNANGVLSFTDADDLTLGSIGLIDGVTTTDNNATLTTGNTLTLAKSLNVGTATASLKPGAGGVNQTGGLITAANALLDGAGSFILTSLNVITTLAANISGGALTVNNAGALIVGTAGSVDGVTVSNNNVNFNTGNTLTLSKGVSLGSGILTINTTTGGVNQTSGALTADSLLLNGAGTFSLASITNNVATLAANVNGALTYTDVDSLSIGTVSAVSGVTTSNNAFTLKADTLDIAQAINAGSGAVVVSQTTNGRTIDLGGNTAGSLAITDVEIDRITASSLQIGDSNSGTLTITDNITPANTSNFLVVAGGAIETAVSKLITSANLTLTALTGVGVTNTVNTASTSLTVSSANGNVGVANTSASAVTLSSISTGTGDISFTQSGGGALTVTSATTTSGAINLSNTGANLTATTVTAGGASKNIVLTTNTSGGLLLGNITAAGDTITLNAAGSIEESGVDGAADLTAGSINLNALTGIGALATLETASSALLAATSNGNIDIDNTNASTTTVSSITTGAGNILLSQAGGGGLSVTNAQTTSGDIGIDVASASLTATGINAGGVAKNVNLTTSTSGNINVVSVTASSAATLNAAGSIVDDATQSTKITASTANLTAASAVGASSNGDIDLDVTSLSVAAGSDAYLNEASALTLTSLTAGTGLASLVSGGALSLLSATTQGNLTLRATSGDITFNGRAQSNAGGVNVQADTGSILATGTSAHIVANADSLISVGQGLITAVGDELNVNITGNLTLDIGGTGITSGKLQGTVAGSTPLFLPSSITAPLRPAGTVYFNGQRVWPVVNTFTLSQASNTLINRFSFPSASQLANQQVIAFDPASSLSTGPVFLYHPLSQLDSAAFDQGFQLDEGAYDYIDGRIEEKKKKEAVTQ